MKLKPLSIAAMTLACLILVSCGNAKSLTGGNETAGSKESKPSPLQVQLWNTVSKPAKLVTFHAKGVDVQVWVGSVRTKNHTDGNLISSSEKAFLDVIGAAEGTSLSGRSQCGGHAGFESLQGCYAYYNFQGMTLSEMQRGHPERALPGSSYAAGRYQFLPDSFAEVAGSTKSDKFPIKDFSPHSQNRAALLAIKWKRSGERVHRVGGVSPHQALIKLDALIKKEGPFQENHWKIFEEILEALSPEWASFPVLGTERSFYDPQPAHRAIELWKVFKEAYKVYEAERKATVAAK